MKICSSCKESKCLIDFSKSIRQKDGLQRICKTCATNYSAKRYLHKKQEILLQQKTYYKNNKEKINLNSTKYKNKNKEKCINLTKEWKKKNLHKVLSSNALRRSLKKQATPQWLNDEDLWMIEEIYELAQLRKNTTKVDWHVDHIVPLVSNIVCGLHVPWNLQVIEARQNLVKYNKF